MKSLFSNPVFQFIVGRLMGGYMLFVGITTRWTRVNRAAVEPFWKPDGGKLIICMWHSRFPLGHKLWAFGRGVPIAKMLVSQSREGGIVAHTAQTVGAQVIRGSTGKVGKHNKGGLEAMRAMTRHIQSGGVIAVTPDGPRGPRMRAQRGPIMLARIAKAPLLPMAWATSHRLVADSWDRFMFPLPFGRGALVWGNPIAPPPPGASDAQIEAVRLQLEIEMNRVTAEADRMMGIEPTEPAPAPTEAEALEDAAALNS